VNSKRPTRKATAVAGSGHRQLVLTIVVIPLAVAVFIAVMDGGVGGLRQTVSTTLATGTDMVRQINRTAPSERSPISGTGTPSDDPETLTVAVPGSMNGYARARFGQPWTDDVNVEGGHNGCDTRNDILQRDLTGVSLSGGCKVMSGTLIDPYLGEVVSFTRGKDTSALVQIDHLVALGNAWVSGAASWSLPRLKQIANDPLNLLAVDGSSNAAKRDYAADKWLPPNPAFRCTYVKRQVMVKNKYQLTVTSAEKAVMLGFYGRC
jgi:hypothetical protein